MFSRKSEYGQCFFCRSIQHKKYMEGGVCRDCRFIRSEFNVMCDWFGNVCLKCGCSGPPFDADHVIAHHNGGSDHLSNIQPLCPSCNRKKHTKNADYRDPVLLAELLAHLGYD